jgi:transcriptional adapter 2-alpha
VKDLEIGVCLEFGGDAIVEDENDQDVRARQRWTEERRSGIPVAVKMPQHAGKGFSNGMVNGLANGHPVVNGDVPRPEVQAKSEDTMENGTTDGDAAVDEITQPQPIESKESLTFKLALLEMYGQRVDKRREGKAIMFDRGLLEYKKVNQDVFLHVFLLIHKRQMQAAEKKRPKEEKDIAHRLRPFARLQTAQDYEVFVADIICTSTRSPVTNTTNLLLSNQMKLFYEGEYKNYNITAEWV